MRSLAPTLGMPKVGLRGIREESYNKDEDTYNFNKTSFIIGIRNCVKVVTILERRTKPIRV